MKQLSFAILLVVSTSIIVTMGMLTENQIMSQRVYAQSTSNGTSPPASCPPGSHLYFWNGKECVPNHSAALP